VDTVTLLRRGGRVLGGAGSGPGAAIPCWPRDRLKAALRRASATRSTKRWSLQNGHMANNQMTNYIMPTAEDVPPIHVFFEEIPFRYGGYGAKGIGELPHDGPAPAILNAIKTQRA
jgi:hypothetical protein